MLTHRLPDGRVPVLLSAHDPGLIGRDASAIADYLVSVGDSADLTAAVATTLLRLRRVRRHRAVVRAADSTELVAGLSAIARGEEHELVSRSAKTTPPRVANDSVAKRRIAERRSAADMRTRRGGALTARPMVARLDSRAHGGLRG